MFNIKSIRAIYTNVVFNPITKARKIPVPKDKSINLIFGEISRSKNIDRLMLLKKTGMSKSCLSRVIFYLFEAGRITRKKIGRSGVNDLYSYSAVKAV